VSPASRPASADGPLAEPAADPLREPVLVARRARLSTAWMIALGVAIAAGLGLPAWLLRANRAEATALGRASGASEPAPTEVPPLPSLTGSSAPATVWLDPPSDQVAEPAAAAGTEAPANGGGKPPGAATGAAPAPPTFEPELQAARAALAARRYDESVTILRDVAVKAGDTTAGIEAQIAMAHVLTRRGQIDEAIAAFAAVVARYPVHQKAAEAMYYQAQAILTTARSDRDREAHTLLTEVADRFGGHPFVPRVLLARGEIESRRKNYQFDDVLGKPVPASLVTYRTLADLGGGGREREHALWRLAQAYERVARYDLAAQTYRDLGEDYARTHYDAWASAARLYDQRLKDPVLARAAYGRVPPTSPAFKDAQKYIRAAG
jgi:TolA-binding protein